MVHARLLYFARVSVSHRINNMRLRINRFVNIQSLPKHAPPNQGVYALGDVCGFWELTPVAIAAGRRLADRLFGGPEHVNARLDYELIPTVVFSHPPAGTIGATEAEAREKYGDANVKCYTSTFVNLHYGIMDTEPKNKPRSHIKVRADLLIYFLFDCVFYHPSPAALSHKNVELNI